MTKTKKIGLRTMKKILFHYLLLIASLCLMTFQVHSQDDNATNKYAFNDEHWKIAKTNNVLESLEVLEYQGRQSILLQAGQKAILKDLAFKNFEIKFSCKGSVPGLAFRVQDHENYEYLYLRMMMSGKQDALQYVPVHNGNLPWQLYNYPLYEGTASYPREKVLSLPLSLSDQLGSGKASKSLLLALKENGVYFSDESFLDIPENSPSYIYDPKSTEALIFEIKDNAIDFLEYRVWINVRVVVVEDRMTVYIDDMDTPIFVVDNLKRDMQAGGINLFSNFGDVYFSDVFVKEIKSDASQSKETQGKQTKQISPSYLTHWNMSDTFLKDPKHKDPDHILQQVKSLLANEHQFKEVSADEDGLINVSRFYGDMEKTTLFSSTFISETQRQVTLNFDFADQLIILFNGETVYEGEMNFRPPSGKGKEGRVFVEDEEITLNMQRGKNRLVFVLSGDYRQHFNWGFIAKLKDVKGISIQQSHANTSNVSVESLQ